MRNLVPAGVRAIAARTLMATGLVLLVAAPGAALADHDGHKVRIDAVVAKGAPPLSDNVKLQVWAREGRKATRLVAESARAPATLSMHPGQYRVVASYKTARTVRDIVVKNHADTRKTINLNAGEIGLELLRQVGGAPVRDSITWQVMRYKRGNGAGGKVATVSNSNPSLLLREGWYEVVATHGNSRTAHVIEVSAGQRFDYSLVMN